MSSISRNASLERDDLVIVGRVSRAQGLKGCMRVAPEVDEPAEVFLPDAQLWMIRRGQRLEEAEIESVEVRPKLVILKLRGVDSIEDAERYRGLTLYVERFKLPVLPEDSFYYSDLVGCQVVLPDESVLGIVEEVQPGPGGDLIVVRQGEKEVLIPAAKEYVKSVSITDKVICVDLPEGMI